MSIFDDLPIHENYNISKAFVFLNETSQGPSESFLPEVRHNFRRDRIDSEDIVFLPPILSVIHRELTVDAELNNFSQDNTVRKRKNSMQSQEEQNLLSEFRVV